jgi:hypothetical protein
VQRTSAARLRFAHESITAGAACAGAFGTTFSTSEDAAKLLSRLELLVEGRHGPGSATETCKAIEQMMSYRLVIVIVTASLYEQHTLQFGGYFHLGGKPAFTNGTGT